jgi:hypothetical protein
MIVLRAKVPSIARGAQTVRDSLLMLSLDHLIHPPPSAAFHAGVERLWPTVGSFHL